MKNGKSILTALTKTIREAERLGYSQYQIAKDSGINRAQLHRLLAGTTVPRLDTVEAVLHVLGLELRIRGRISRRKAKEKTT